MYMTFKFSWQNELLANNRPILWIIELTSEKLMLDNWLTWEFCDIPLAQHPLKGWLLYLAAGHPRKDPGAASEYI